MQHKGMQYTCYQFVSEAESMAELWCHRGALQLVVRPAKLAEKNSSDFIGPQISYMIEFPHKMIKYLFQVATLVALFTSQIWKRLELLFSVIINRAGKSIEVQLKDQLGLDVDYKRVPSIWHCKILQNWLLYTVWPKTNREKLNFSQKRRKLNKRVQTCSCAWSHCSKVERNSSARAVITEEEN